MLLVTCGRVLVCLFSIHTTWPIELPIPGPGTCRHMRCCCPPIWPRKQCRRLMANSAGPLQCTYIPCYSTYYNIASAILQCLYMDYVTYSNCCITPSFLGNSCSSFVHGSISLYGVHGDDHAGAAWMHYESHSAYKSRLHSNYWCHWLAASFPTLCILIQFTLSANQIILV